MFFNKDKTAKSSQPTNKARISGSAKPHLVREAWWLIFTGLGSFLALILFTFNLNDASWSHSGGSETITSNAGGVAGAWISDILLSVFGFSAWLWVLLAFCAVWLVYQRLDVVAHDSKPPLVLNIIGFFMLLIASCALESGHLVALPAHLPAVAGGMLGSSLDGLLQSLLGFIGSSLLLLVMWLAGFSLFTGWSWILITEKIGGWLINSCFLSLKKWHEWQDRRVGKVAEQLRTEYVEVERKKYEDRPAIVIEAPDFEIKKSERVDIERQTPLFETLPDSPLPPLHLLDEPSNHVEAQSFETLEFTSRLIERKLMDFGIEVKVMTAQPGPVITRYELEPAAGVKGSQVTNLAKDLARALSVASVRVVETIPGKVYMGLEIPNPKRQIVYLSEILS